MEGKLKKHTYFLDIAKEKLLEHKKKETSKDTYFLEKVEARIGQDKEGK